MRCLKRLPWALKIDFEADNKMSASVGQTNQNDTFQHGGLFGKSCKKCLKNCLKKSQCVHV